MRKRTAGAAGAILLVSSWILAAETPVRYRLSFPEPEHRWMEVEARFSDLDVAPLEIRMSRASPGRYALHEFAKNVYDVRAYGAGGAELALDRPDRHGWRVRGHGGAVRLVYKVYGDRLDGTYLAVDATHAHINMPAALVWARGLEMRPAEVQFVPPEGAGWKVASQLFPTSDDWIFTAPNLHYLMDSPVELSAFSMRAFRLDDATAGSASPEFRVVVHHQGTEAEVDAFAADIEKLALEERAVFGELPSFDGGAYTFIADYLPHAAGDGMEHRNSTILTSPGSLAQTDERRRLLGTAAHELFHAWNVERIRPRSLEPFDFERANESEALWLAEGFTSYYDALILHRAGLVGLSDTAGDLAGFLNTVLLSPGRRFRSPVEMSRLAPFVDAASWIDRTYWENTYISYYTWGAAIGLGLDLELRARSGGRVSLDDFMRALWEAHGRPNGEPPGYVARPYTLEDVQAILGDVAGDPGFAASFFSRYVRGREVVDYAPLLDRAGLVLRPKAPDRAWLGELRLEYGSGGALVTAPVPLGAPIYDAGLERDDRLISLDGEAITSTGDLERFLEGRRPGDAIEVSYIRRGKLVRARLVLGADPAVEIVPRDREELSREERDFRDAWLGSALKRE